MTTLSFLPYRLAKKPHTFDITSYQQQCAFTDSLFHLCKILKIPNIEVGLGKVRAERRSRKPVISYHYHTT
jgi:hypothetical protein